MSTRVKKWRSRKSSKASKYTHKRKNGKNLPMNIVIKSIIVSDFVFWVSWNFLAPLFSVFVVNEISGGDVKIVTTSFSFFLMVRMGMTYLSGRVFNGLSERIRLGGIIGGIILMSVSYLVLAFINEIHAVFIFYGLAGVGMGISGPLKLTLFTKHIDKDNECTESGTWDTVSLLGSSIASFIGGLIVYYYGFRVLFSLAAFINLVSMIPFIYVIEYYEKFHPEFRKHISKVAPRQRST